MTAKIEFKGTDVDEAINKACAKFSVPREKLNIEIVSTGSTGIFGLCKKKAIIKVSPKKAISPRAKSKDKPSRNDSPKASTKSGNKEKKPVTLSLPQQRPPRKNMSLTKRSQNALPNSRWQFHRQR